MDGFDPCGPGYPAFVRPFLRAVRNPYVAHRVANLAALAAACALLGLVLRANRCPAAVAAGLVTVFYALQAGSYSIQARPDFLVAAEILVLLALGQPAVRARFHPAIFALLFGGAALAAYLTKPYTLLASAVVILHGLWCGPRRPAVRTAVVAGGILAGGVAAFARANPYYLFEAFLSHLAKPENDGAWFLHQWRDFALLAFAVVVLGAIPVAREVRPFCARLPHALWRPQPAEAATGYWSLAAAAGFAALLGPPGWRIGAYLTYHFHLLLPPLLVLAGLACRPATGEEPAVRLPWRELLLADHLAEYRVARVFRIHPYYFPTNAPRGEAGTWGTDILKLVRSRPLASPAGSSPHRD